MLFSITASGHKSGQLTYIIGCLDFVYSLAHKSCALQKFLEKSYDLIS